MKKPTLLIIEDEPAILQGLIDVFLYHGYEVDSSSDGELALEKIRGTTYDMILLDVMLPKIDGFTLCNEIRKLSRTQPVIMLTAKTSEEDIINGLSLGADDYVGKPFSVRQLVLRVEAVLRRTQRVSSPEPELKIGGYWLIDCANLTGKRLDQPELAAQNFTRREVEILQYLQTHSTRPVPREELLESVWGYRRASEIETRTVDIHIAKLRKKIEPDHKVPTLLVTIRGEGYKLVD